MFSLELIYNSEIGNKNIAKFVRCSKEQIKMKFMASCGGRVPAEGCTSG